MPISGLARPRCQRQIAREGEAQSHGAPGSEPAGLPLPAEARDQGPGKANDHRPNDPFRRVHPHAPQASPARSGREGLHAHRAPGRHPDHRHPRRDRSARLPQPAREGAGLRRPRAVVRTAQTAHGDVLHRQPDLRRRRRQPALRDASSRRCKNARPSLFDTAPADRLHDRRHVEGLHQHRFSIANNAGTVTRACVAPPCYLPGQGRLPRRAAAGSHQLHSSMQFREAGLRARFVVKALKRPRARADTVTRVP